MRGYRRLSALLFICASALLISAPASAQFVCTTTATDVTCTNSGTAASEANFDLNKNVTTINSGTVTTSMSSTTGNSGNATTINTGSVGTDINTTSATNGDASTTNYGSVGGSVSTISVNGNSVGINYGMIGGNFTTLNQSGGVANGINYGTVGGTFQVTSVFANVFSANYGSVNAISISAPNNGGVATITNAGSVTTSITSFGFAGSTITNSGSVGTSISASTAISGNASVTNTGSVGTDISATTSTGGNATITNSGLIGGFAHAIAAAGGDATITNSGSIGGDLQAVGVFGAATIVNYGTTGAWTVSAPAGSDAIGVNYGTVNGQITVLGQGSQSLTNGGTINNPGGTAISFNSASPSSLTLKPGSFIVGAINFNAGGTNTVNLQTGNLNLTINPLAGATVTGSVPFVVSGNRVATVDPTPFGMTDRNLLDFSRSVSAAIPETAMQSATFAKALPFSGEAASPAADAFAGVSGLSAYAQRRTVPANPTATYSNGMSVWARTFAGQRDQDTNGTMLQTTNNYYGAMFGFDMQARSDLRLGLFGGAGQTRSTVDFNSGSNTGDTIFAGAFAQYVRGNMSLRGIMQMGHSSTDTSRNINNNLAPGGLEVAKGSYGTTYFSPEANLAMKFGIGSLHGASYALTPSVNVRYLFAAVDGYTETGSTSNLSVGSRNVQDFEERAQLKLTGTTLVDANKVLMGSVYGGVVGVQRVGGTTVDATLLGQPIPFAAPGEDNVIGGFTGAGIEWHFGGTTLFGNAEFAHYSDSSNVVGGQGGIKVSF